MRRKDGSTGKAEILWIKDERLPIAKFQSKQAVFLVNVDENIVDRRYLETDETSQDAIDGLVSRGAGGAIVILSSNFEYLAPSMLCFAAISRHGHVMMIVKSPPRGMDPAAPEEGEELCTRP